MELAVQTREMDGKKAKALRKEGLVPAELYGHGVPNMHLSVPVKDFTKILKQAGTSTVVTLVVGKEKKPVIIHEVTQDFVTGNVAHVDFYQVKMNEKMTAKVPVEFVGIAPAVKEKQAVINKSIFEIEIEALPADLPHSLAVDLSVLDDLHKSIYIKDIRMPKGVHVLADLEAAVATAMPPVKEEEKVEVPVDVSEVKVESEEKKAERAAEKGEASAEKKGDTK